jgi:hypothetical protein
MSKIREILQRAERQNPGREVSLSTVRAETSQLWPRFTKVFDAIACSFGNQPTPLGIKRESSTFSWNGVDQGIHDHSGFITGRTNDIELQISLKGTTIDDQQKYVIDPDGSWRLVHARESYITIQGTFVSADGQNGAVEMQLENGVCQYKAFWLQAQNGILRLEQVVGQDGKIYDAEKLEPGKREVSIPGSGKTVTRLKTQ